MLQAQRHWQWQISSEQNRLVLDMGEMQFCTPYKLRQLTDEALSEPQFNLLDADFYKQVGEYLSTFNLWSDAQICQIALNATAVKHYLKPVLAKSWFLRHTPAEISIKKPLLALLHSAKAASFSLLIVPMAPVFVCAWNHTSHLMKILA